ncbi:gamma-glutamyl-gamma-aminobutyrate hydrolase family protein [Desulfuribacillus alkaliarsenatis]|uniref:Uncharacterized protein n=1 Tax=Desulfuribacillus alkaliarsenatis TaxID=766136 RepID=A0A1E5FZ79_9FIRM|nr:gamma-glutamyl-gamma-aminobutyrate hydrolase family protein [Desulfuribacillus alkaliarsenatis]OEF95880.1 hypothetical protein BHF68_10830 [Desulfuribacillus alkaliarsenatis]
MRPRIAVTGTSMETKYGSGTYINKGYIDGVIKAGGIPIVLPLTELKVIDEEWIEQYDGLLLSGGEDVNPLRYKQSPQLKQGRISPERDELECTLIPLAIKRNMPIFAICRGVQVLNVVCGGTLYQDIVSQVPNVLKHSQNAPRWYGTHAIEIVKDSKLHAICKQPSIVVNSYHHQAIDVLAEGLTISAKSEDGIIEAIESTDDKVFIVGVQWHPEGMWQKEKEQFALFEAFVAACKQTKLN